MTSLPVTPFRANVPLGDDGLGDVGAAVLVLHQPPDLLRGQRSLSEKHFIMSFYKRTKPGGDAIKARV